MIQHILRARRRQLERASDSSRIVRHTLAYLLARGIPGVLALLSIPVFTNFLEPGEYGSYALMVLAINVANSALFQWIRLALVRHFPVEPERLQTFRSTIVTLWLAISLGVGATLLVVLLLGAVRPIAAVLILGWVVLTTQALFDLVTEFLRADLRPWHFMTLQLIRASSLVGLGFVLLRAGMGWTGPLIAVAVGMALAAAWAWRQDWLDARLRPDQELAREMLRYGAPVSLTVALAGAIFLIDRTLVAILLGNDAAGIYSVAFDFTTQTVTLAMMAVSMAAFPIAVRELETRGVEAACRPMATNARLLLAVGVPATVGAGVLAPAIASTFFGDGYEAAADIIPLVGLSALIAGLKAYHFDAALQFAKRTAQQVWIVLVAAVVSVLLNLLLIPTIGLRGTALASVLTFLLAAVLTAWWGRHYFPLPFPVREAARVVLATAVMGAVLYPFRSHGNLLQLVSQILAGACVYGVVLVAVNGFGLRARAVDALKRRRRPSTSGRADSGGSRSEGPRTDVCMYSPYPTGGMPRYVAELMHAMTRTSDRPGVEWVCSTDLDPRFLAEDYVVHPVLPAMREKSTFRTSLGWALSRCRHYVRRELCFLSWLRERPDLGVVHLQEMPPAIAHFLVRRLKKRGKAVFVTVHNVKQHGYPRFLPRGLVDASLRRAYSECESLFVHTAGLAAELETFMRLTGTDGKPRIRVVEHGVWTVHPAAFDTEALRSRLRARSLLFFGTIRQNKGLHLLLEAAADGELEGFRITVAGEPMEMEYLEETVLPLAARARAIGVPVDVDAQFVPDEAVDALFAAHSALVLPYTNDFVAQSGAAFMGLAYAMPIVATPAGGLGHLMASRHVGVVAREPTPRAVADAIHELFSASARDLDELAQGMRNATEAAPSWTDMAAATIEEYRRVATASGSAHPRHATAGT